MEALEEAVRAPQTTGDAVTAETWDGRDVSFPPLRPSEDTSAPPVEAAEAAQEAESRGALTALSTSSAPTAPTAPAGLPATVTQARKGPAAQILAVTGARGGLGVSVLLLHLAWALSRAGRRVAMMDLYPAGGLDLLCGETVLTGLRWADLPAEESAFRPGHLVGALPVWHAMPVLTADVRGGPSSCADAVLEAMRTEHDVVLVDLPRGAPPPPGARVLLVTGLDLRSAVAAESVAPRLRGPHPSNASPAADPGSPSPVWLVVRRSGEDVVPEDLELITGCPVLGHVPTDRVLTKRLALGEDPVRARSATRRAASALARELLARVLVAEPPQPVPTAAGGAPQPAGGRVRVQERGSRSWSR
ncbi:cellulose synthase operon protein YhjQ/BcsQ [Actinomyces sp. ZJ308]|uniref:cellulose synthase operon protein YhjQ/BcsQ n=1 Tax=Actinomyces sp. ZJ308 TaxID=2708342 RepID=UPI001FBBDC5B|nr:cellulose synthase operon protein YhjQ/BcsQ [Actinomyces sp. ZJ308]